MVDADRYRRVGTGADRIRQERQQDEFDMCSVISIKGGRCSEDCKFCSQASCSKAAVKSYPLRGTEEIMEVPKSVAHRESDIIVWWHPGIILANVK